MCLIKFTYHELNVFQTFSVRGSPLFAAPLKLPRIVWRPLVLLKQKSHLQPVFWKLVWIYSSDKNIKRILIAEHLWRLNYFEHVLSHFSWLLSDYDTFSRQFLLSFVSSMKELSSFLFFFGKMKLKYFLLDVLLLMENHVTKSIHAFLALMLQWRIANFAWQTLWWNVCNGTRSWRHWYMDTWSECVKQKVDD